MKGGDGGNSFLERGSKANASSEALKGKTGKMHCNHFRSKALLGALFVENTTFKSAAASAVDWDIDDEYIFSVTGSQTHRSDKN